MGFDLTVSISAITVLIQGLLSFFSPCVLPLLPVYLGYLSGGTITRDESGALRYDRGRAMRNTIFFVLGISAAFFLLGFGMTQLGRLFSSHQVLLSRVGGVIVILFGLYQLGLLGSSRILGNTRRVQFKPERLMSPLTALLMGFFFSFSWTPCVGPALTSVLLMAASSSGKGTGYLLIGVYTAGFALPFLVVGLFAASLLEWLRQHRGALRYTTKLGGALMILMGILMLTGWMSRTSGVLAAGTAGGEISHDAVITENTDREVIEEEEETVRPASAESESNPERDSDQSDVEEAEPVRDMAPDFELRDQTGKLHRLSEYRGKVVFLNFWATWCPPCRAEMPDIEALYEKYEKDSEVVILGVACPGYGQEVSEAEVAGFLEENGYFYPTVMDPSGDLLLQYSIMAFPTTYMIDRDGRLFGYVAGSMSMDIMEDIIQQTLDGVRR